MNLSIEQDKSIIAFAMIVDINSFTKIVELSERKGFAVSNFISDLLSSSINTVEKSGGLVVAFMGDAFLAILESADQVSEACIGIAVHVDKVNDYFNSEPNFFPVPQKGFKLKIGIEYGVIDISEIQSNFLGKQKLFIGSPINYASRITKGGNKSYNRCLFGPKSLAAGLNHWPHKGPFQINGKKGEGKYEYYILDLDDVWRNHPTETSWR
ncbi:MAG TPA: adenylate/guanylate cyclase domain-containing protein [Parafilimonas sp.]|nr:adenylate/guanylate cyclase domain-containing protein [Parafilimonas sp.]